ncbi:MAG: MFS transporter [Proteobacteria bacterium]|nr:MFS transporter [Pseudomonadota bacterium]
MSGARPFDAPERIAYVNALFIIGSLATLITPAVLDAWAPLNWSPGRLGLIAGIELAGLALGSLSGLYWQRRWSWRAITAPSLVACLVANLACVGLTDFMSVCAARAVVGIAGGLLCGVYSAYAANITNPVRVIAATTFVQVALEALFIFFAPSLSHLRSGALFLLMALLFALLLPLIRLLPSRWPEADASADGTTRHSRSWRGYVILASFIPFVVVQTGIYTFLGEFAQSAARVSSEEALRLVGISVVFSALGSLLAFGAEGRISVRTAIVVSIVFMAATLAGALHPGSSSAWFLVNIAVMQIAWIFLNCMLYAALIQTNNLLVAAASTVACLGASVGTPVVGFVFEHTGLGGALSLSMCALAATAALTVPILGRANALPETS